MRIAICEDEIVVANSISEKISSILNKKKIKHGIDMFYNGNDLLDIYTEQYDILFLDIYLPDINGYNVAQKIRKIDDKVIIVFLTSSNEYVFEGYNVAAFNYILKGDFNNKIEFLIDSINKNLKTKNSYIITRNKLGSRKVLCDDIIYISSNLRKLLIATKSERITVYGKLSDYEKKLLKLNFIKPHQSYIINQKYIKAVTSESILLDDDSLIPISRVYKTETRKKVFECMD